MHPTTPKAVWGFNGTERPGAVYLAAVLAAHAQKGRPAFGIYGRDVQDAGDTEIPEDVREKLLSFSRAGLAVAMLRGKTYLSIGGSTNKNINNVNWISFREHFFSSILILNDQVNDVDISSEDLASNDPDDELNYNDFKASVWGLGCKYNNLGTSDGVSMKGRPFTFRFDVSDASNANHPLRFYANSSQYSTDVVVIGTQGSAGAKVQIVIPETQPSNFQYYCTNHSGMGNTITVKDDPIKTVSDNVVKILAVADNSSNINAVQANESNINAVQANASNINAAVSNASNINAVVSNATNINTVAGNNSNVTSVANNTSNINSAVSNASNINAAVSNATNINTVSGSIGDVNRYANEYKISSSAPGSPSAGDLWFDTSGNTLKNYNGSAWLGITSNSGIQNVADDTSPQLAATLDGQNNNLTNIGTIDGANLQLDFGTL